MASQWPPKKNTAFTLDFTLYKNDGTIVANPGTYTKKVSIDGGDVADIAANVTEENTTYGQLSLVIASGEMNGDRIWIYITDNTAGTVPFTATLLTSAYTLDEIGGYLAHADYGLAKLVRSTTPANTLTVDVNNKVAVPDTQDVNVKTFGGETLTAQIIAAWKKFFNVASPTGNVNSLPDAVPGANGGFPTTNGTKINQTVDLTAGQSIACSDKTGFSLSATGADLILKSSTFVQAIVAAVNEFATYGLTALNTLLVTTGIKAASVPNVTLANGAHGGAATTITLQTPVDSNVTQIGGVAQSATDLKDFADTGYDPSSHKVAGVVLTDTCTTNTDMRGTNGAYTGTPPTADAIGTDAASKVLVTPAQKIVTDADGKVTYSNTAPPTAEDIKTAIEAEGSKLDHLWEMTEDDGGTRRLTTNSLEQAPTGGSAPTAVAIREEIDSNSTQLSSIKGVSDKLNNMIEVVP